MKRIAASHPTIVSRGRRLAALGAGCLLATAAVVLAPSSALLSAPDTEAEYVVAALVLGTAFAAGFFAPRPGLYALVVVAILEGAFRKWVLNDVVVFLVKDFLALGVYAAVLPQLRRDEWRRPWWLLTPAVALVLLALLYTTRSDSWSQAMIGLRGWTLYVPLLWVAPKLLATRTYTLALVLLVLAAGIAESALATAQSLTGDEWLNRVVPGSTPPLVTIDNVSYLRPTGTMLQVGAFSVFILFAVLAAYALVAATSKRVLLAFGGMSPAVLVWAISYAGGRALFLGVAAASFALVAYLLWRRRFLTLVGVIAAFAVGYGAMVVQPFADASSGEQRTIEYQVLDDEGRVYESSVRIGLAPPREGLIDRATAIERGDVGAKPHTFTSNRIRGQLLFVKDQPMLGRGTGRMTLGTEYVLPTEKLAAESVYAKAAYELGLPGFVLLVWLFVALAVATAVGAVMTLEWRRAAALVGFGGACIVPVWCLFNFTLDMPIASILYWSFAGIATAWASPFAQHRG